MRISLDKTIRRYGLMAQSRASKQGLGQRIEAAGSTRLRRSSVSKAKIQASEQEGTTPLRARVWETAFEWAKKELGTDNKNARQIADAAVAGIDPQPASAR
jgi:hypothetical protein